MEEMKSKLRKLESIHHTTNAMIAQFHLHPKRSIKRKTSIHPLVKKRTLQPLLHPSIHSPKNEMKTPININLKPESFHPNPVDDHPPVTPNLITSSPNLNSPINDESTRSTASSSSPSKNSHDEPPLAPDTLIIGKFYILNDIYPSIDSEHLKATPLAFLGSEKLLRLRIDWTKVRYPLSTHYIEIIIDLILTRPSFVREIPQVTQFNIYRPLNQIISGRLFFDHGEHKAAIHRCHQKLKNYKFTIEDLASIHRREFYIINYNTTREQRFINLYENLFQMHLYPTKSN